MSVNGPVNGDDTADDRGGALVPAGWCEIAGLVCGFGGRRRGGPPATEVAQVHGARLVRADELGAGAPPASADGLTVTAAGGVVAVRTADCVPILLVAAAGGWAAAVHAGWRGTVANIAAEAVAEAGRAGFPASVLLAALGPSIGPCCYEVGEEVAEFFELRGLPVARGEGKPHVDLREANAHLLSAAGVPAGAIQVCGPCTRCSPDRYYSYRANPGELGRQRSWIGWR